MLVTSKLLDSPFKRIHFLFCLFGGVLPLKDGGDTRAVLKVLVKTHENPKIGDRGSYGSSRDSGVLTSHGDT